MIRIKRGKTHIKKRKFFLNLAKGYRKGASNLYTLANEQVIQSLYYSYISRRLKKRFFRKLWIQRIKAGSLYFDYKYSSFMSKLKKHNIFLNRKILAYFLNNDFSIFKFFINFI